MAALTFSPFFSLKYGKWGPWKENGDLLGTKKLKKVPMGTRVPKWGPTWEKSIPSALDINLNPRVSGNFLGVGDRLSNISLVLVEHGYNIDIFYCSES